MVLTHFKRRHLILELLTLVALISFALFLAFQWQTIIEPLPTHFGFDGQPDAWGDKSSLLVSLVIVVVIYILLLVVEFFPAFGIFLLLLMSRIAKILPLWHWICLYCLSLLLW